MSEKDNYAMESFDMRRYVATNPSISVKTVTKIFGNVNPVADLMALGNEVRPVVLGVYADSNDPAVLKYVLRHPKTPLKGRIKAAVKLFFMKKA